MAFAAGILLCILLYGKDFLRGENDRIFTHHSNEEKESIPVRSFSGDLIKKSPLGMMQGCQTTPTIMPRRTSDELYTKS